MEMVFRKIRCRIIGVILALASTDSNEMPYAECTFFTLVRYFACRRHDAMMNQSRKRISSGFIKIVV